MDTVHSALQGTASGVLCQTEFQCGVICKFHHSHSYIVWPNFEHVQKLEDELFHVFEVIWIDAPRVVDQEVKVRFRRLNTAWIIREIEWEVNIVKKNPFLKNPPLPRFDL